MNGKYNIDYNNRGKILIDIKLQNLDPLHVGVTESGIQLNESDLLCIKHKDGRPFIPGSSFRGFFRALAERFSHLFESNNSVAGITLNIEHKFPQNNRNKDVCDLKEVLDEIANKQENIVEDYLISKKKICDLCLLFGANHYGSPLRISDFNTFDRPSFENRTHIKIDPDSDTTAERALFYVEAVEPGIEFAGKMIFEKRGHQNQKKIITYLILLLEYLRRNEIYLGGLKSRGYGRMQCVDIEITDYSLKDEILGIEKNPQKIKSIGGN
jgi:CRISPR-associated RAMP protein (TIGR02581 family)